MNISEDLRKYAAEQGIAETSALARGMEANTEEFLKQGGELYVKD